MRRVIAVFTVAVAGFAVVPQMAVGALIERVSVATDGTQANGYSLYPAVSADGRYVAFESFASNLVPGDTNGAEDVFVRDLQSGTTQRVSAAADGTEANGNSRDPAISADGRFVAFDSFASNLPGSAEDVFVSDLQSGTTQRVSVAADGTEVNGDSGAPAISADGRYVAFASDASNLVPSDPRGYPRNEPDVFVRDLQSRTTRRVSVAANGTQTNSDSENPAISADGRYVAFESDASNLVPGDTNGYRDVFVRDLQSGTTQQVSVAANGTQANLNSYLAAISADGRYVAFESDASNLVPGDTNGAEDVFVRDLESGTTQRVSVAANGTEANGASFSVAMSADGRYVAFESRVPGDKNHRYDVFVRDLQSGTTRRVSVAANGTEANGASFTPAISADGRYVAFDSGASNLVPRDTNNQSDVFVRDLNRKPGRQRASNTFTVSRIKTRADGTITFSVRVPGPGSVDVLETAWNDNLASAAMLLKPAPHRFAFARRHVRAARRGTLSATVTPNQRGNLVVAHPRYGIVLRLWVRYTPRGGRYRTIGFLGLHLPGSCANHDTVTARSRTVVRCD